MKPLASDYQRPVSNTELLKILICKNKASVARRIKQSLAQAKFEARVYNYLNEQASQYDLAQLDAVEEAVMAADGMTEEQKLQFINLRPVNECEQALVLGQVGTDTHQLYSLYEQILRPTEDEQ